MEKAVRGRQLTVKKSKWSKKVAGAALVTSLVYGISRAGAKRVSAEEVGETAAAMLHESEAEEVLIKAVKTRTRQSVGMLRSLGKL
jgi:RNA 3'-terminal phosphate cyclase